jgi:hydroxyacylglutathione hydrolase
MVIKKIKNDPISSNCYVIHNKVNQECLIIDPGTENNYTLNKYLNYKKIFPKYVILTHEHFDHIWGVIDLQKKYNFILICNKVCSNAISDPKKICHSSMIKKDFQYFLIQQWLKY